jgi:small subunit ribosomal protein S2
MMFVLDAAKEYTAVLEANTLGIPVVAPLDTNCDPDLITYPIPGNDDAIRSIQLFCREMAAAVNEGKALRDAPAQDEQTQEVEATETEANAEETTTEEV